MHGKAKEQAEIGSEKEIIETSTVEAMGKNKYGNITQNELEEKLNNNAGNDKTEVIDDGDILVVKFVDSGRYYEVDNDGNVSEPVEMFIDEYAGDLTKGGRCDGSEEKLLKYYEKIKIVTKILRYVIAKSMIYDKINWSVKIRYVFRRNYENKFIDIRKKYVSLLKSLHAVSEEISVKQ